MLKAKTWEELRMTAEEDEALYEAAKTLFYNSSEAEIRMRCLDREEYYQDMRNYERKIEQDRMEHERLIAEKDEALAEKNEQYQRSLAEIEKLPCRAGAVKMLMKRLTQKIFIGIHYPVFFTTTLKEIGNQPLRNKPRIAVQIGVFLLSPMLRYRKEDGKHPFAKLSQYLFTRNNHIAGRI